MSLVVKIEAEVGLGPVFLLPSCTGSSPDLVGTAGGDVTSGGTGGCAGGGGRNP